MIPAVLLLTKYSVFEMLGLESDIQQTNGTFTFLLQILVTEKVDEDWCFLAVSV